jgi:hypothetical protein
MKKSKDMDDWKDFATCSPDSDPTPGSKKDAQSYIDMFCSKCPVTHECLTGATTEDLFWSVRSGLMPERFGSKSSRPKATKWLPKEPPLKPREGATLLERGICREGLHGILSIEDIRNQGCRGCQNMKATIAYKAMSANKSCSNGHPKTPENWGKKEVTRKGLPMTINFCIPCRDARARVKSTCSHGHPRTAEFGKFSYYERNGKQVGQWVCLKCHRMRVKGAFSSHP